MADAHRSPPGHDDLAAHLHHETTDVNVGGVLTFGAGLVVVAVIVHLLVWLMLGYFIRRSEVHGAREYPLAAAEQNRLPPEPRLQTNPREDLRLLRENEDEVLNSYGWVDKNAGVVRIPIEEAMKIVVQQGLPTRPASSERR
jgi:hypothetical protein